jgi:hypothetical protein
MTSKCNALRGSKNKMPRSDQNRVPIGLELRILGQPIKLQIMQIRIKISPDQREVSTTRMNQSFEGINLSALIFPTTQ